MGKRRRQRGGVHGIVDQDGKGSRLLGSRLRQALSEDRRNLAVEAFGAFFTGSADVRSSLGFAAWAASAAGLAAAALFWGFFASFTRMVGEPVPDLQASLLGLLVLLAADLAAGCLPYGLGLIDIHDRQDGRVPLRRLLGMPASPLPPPAPAASQGARLALPESGPQPLRPASSRLPTLKTLPASWSFNHSQPFVACLLNAALFLGTALIGLGAFGLVGVFMSLVLVGLMFILLALMCVYDAVKRVLGPGT